MSIEQCLKCGEHFNDNMMKQAEVRAELLRFGEASARSVMIELMEPVHEDHIQPEVKE